MCSRIGFANRDKIIQRRRILVAVYEPSRQQSGLCRAKNTANILAKNYIVFAISSVAFLLIGFGLMFGNGNGIVGVSGLWFVSGTDNSPMMGDMYMGDFSALSWTGIPLWAKFFF